jgi:excisionase family DNA binding protein
MPRNSKASGIVADPLLTQTELAEYLRKPEGTLEQWRSRGGGPEYLKIGRHVRYQLSAVNAWLESRRRVSAGATDGRG